MTKFLSKSIFYLTGAVIMLVIALVAGGNFSREEDLSELVKKTQQIITKKENELSIALENIQIYHAENSYYPFRLTDIMENSTDEESGLTFLIFKEDSLIYWSNNKIPVDRNIFNESGIAFTGNSWNLKKVKETSEHVYVGLFTIKSEYVYQNDYLENKYHSCLNLTAKTELSTEIVDSHAIYDSKGKFLFSLKLYSPSQLTDYQEISLLFLYLLSISLFIAFVYEIFKNKFHKLRRKTIFVVALSAIVILIRVIIFFFKIPPILYHSKLFSPHYYGISEWIPSFGDLIINVSFVFIISLFVFFHFRFHYRIRRRLTFFRYFYAFSLLLHIFIFYKGINFLMESLVNDSIISIDLNNIYSLNWIGLVTFAIIFMAMAAYLLITSRLAFMAFKSSLSSKEYFLIFIFVLILWATYVIIVNNHDLISIVFVSVYIISLGAFFHHRIFRFNLASIGFFIILFSILSTVLLHRFNAVKEMENRKFLAINLSAEKRDPIAEFMFHKKSLLIENDTALQKAVTDYINDSISIDSLTRYISREHFSDYWRNYDQQVTVCDRNDYLIINPENVEIGCWEFFDTIIKTKSRTSPSENLFFLSYGPGDNGYLVILDYATPGAESDSVKVFIELTPKYLAKDLGFPDLLIDREIAKKPDMSDYSYAVYNDGVLQQRVGKYFYNFNLYHYSEPNDRIRFFDKNGYNHLIFKADDSRVIFISKKNKSFLDVVAPFSYLLIFFSILSITILLIYLFIKRRSQLRVNFRARLQLSMAFVLLFSFIALGIFTMRYIVNLNNQKNNDILTEKTHSVLVELQHKLINEEKMDETISPYLGDLLVKFSNVFFTDINLYSVNGTLLASSRPQIFDEKLISKNMNPLAFRELSMHSSSVFVQNESIGKQRYLSAYIPFVNNKNSVIAYLNLPYFAKENDLQREVSDFLVAYINIYVILIALSIIISLIVSNYVSQPIKLIMNKISRVNLAGSNEKINWQHNDEIGQLVNSYNRMVDELAISAERLAKSERETAWQEMARQVAHEIKNPLTPMKLSVQHLQHAWNRKAPDWENRLKKFSQTMVEQIDALSVIATEFSDFSKMPDTKKEIINLSEIIYTTINLFDNIDNLTITFKKDTENVFVLADKVQMIRALNNLTKNAVQAVSKNVSGKIDIELSQATDYCTIKFTDNGGGIDPELTDRIFTPYFTTKSSGMGLGLAIVKSFVLNSNGEIRFETAAGKGTTFIIRLPLAKPL